MYLFVANSDLIGIEPVNSAAWPSTLPRTRTRSVSRAPLNAKTCDAMSSAWSRARVAPANLIEGAIKSARGYLDAMEKGPGFSKLLWNFVDGSPKVNHFKSGKQIPVDSPISKAMSKELASRGFKFVGPTIVYAWMQAVGIVNDHSVNCFRRAQVALGE